MSYLASFDGKVKFRTLSADERDLIIKACEDVYSDAVDFITETEMIICGMANYYEDCVQEWLGRIAPYTIDGTVRFVGEDESSWKFLFLDGRWTEETNVDYQDGKKSKIQSVYDSIQEYSVKALVLDYTSNDVFVNKDGMTTVWCNDSGCDVYKGPVIKETEQELLIRLVQIGAKKTIIERD